jgi:exodeoxyribonuclease III
MKVATWNVNSLRARLSVVEDWLRLVEPDVLLVQETKVVDEDFPADPFTKLGYETVRAGQSTYNGVAILSRLPLTNVKVGLEGALPEDDKRLISAEAGGITFLSAYVPNGKTLDSPSYPEKLEWLRRLRQTLDARYSSRSPVILGGDFNVARDERDVAEPEKMLGQLHFSVPERERISEVLAFGLKDAFREKESGKGHYSWWDYRMGAYRRNKGLRIDYLFVTDEVMSRLTDVSIDKRPRSWEKPSDHAPVVLELKPPS